MSRARSDYLQHRTLAGPWRLEGEPAGGFARAVVIPALAEFDSLFTTLDSLAANPPASLARTLVVVVVNQRCDAPDELRQENLQTLGRLSAYAASSPLNLGWVDAASPGLELPNRKGGVGMARKLGSDLALTQLAIDGFIAFLDADTLVQPDYLPALERHFADATAGAAVIPYCHQPGATSAQQAAIERYELYLRHYVLGLKLAGSPYAYHSIGSALAFRVAAYLRCGGMNLRSAGEDFYLLQQLAKTSGVARLQGTRVFPSARCSARVPFGTGEKVARLMEGEETAVSFYATECFQVLARWLQIVTTGLQRNGDALLQDLTETAPAAAEFLRQAGFCESWGRLQANHCRDEQRLAAFHEWFDALRTLRLIHHLSDVVWPRRQQAAALAPLLRWAGYPAEVDKLPNLLVLLRS